MSVVKISWKDCLAATLVMSEKIRDTFPAVTPVSEIRVWGVPRGGSLVALMLNQLGFALVSCVEDADVIVDDLVDSGRTQNRYKAWHTLPFFALYEKKKMKGVQWIQFPWDEEEPNKDPEDSVVRLLQFLGEDPKREGLLETPKRVVKALQEMTQGYQQDPAKILGTTFGGDGYDEMVVCRNIPFHSMCEHHMLGFTGVAHVAYIPKSRVVGLSKMPRLVDCFAKRLQIQERLTRQIADAMQTHLKPKGVGVIVSASHSCMCCRGVGKHGSDMVTSALLGNFRLAPVRQEFFSHVRGGVK